MVVVEPLAGSLAPRLLPRPIAIGNKTFDSTPKDSRKGCPYNWFELFIIRLKMVVGANPCVRPCTDVVSASARCHGHKRFVQRTGRTRGNSPDRGNVAKRQKGCRPATVRPYDDK